MLRRAMRVRWSRLAVLAAAVAVALPALAISARADVPLPTCDISCDSGSGGGGTVGEGGVAPDGATVVLASPERTFLQFPGATDANDVATSIDGSVWIITGTSTRRIVDGAFGGPGVFGVGGMRLAVGPSGLPWMVGFDGRIFRGNADGSVTLMPGLARDIGIGAQGSVWVIGTNSRNGSFQVYAWNGSSWTADPGSGLSIDVDASGHPIVNGSDDKIWIKNGGADAGWTLLTGRATDIAVGQDSSIVGNGGSAGSPGGSQLWIIGQDPRGAGFGVWTFTAFNMTWTLTNQTFGGLQIAADMSARAWVVEPDHTVWTG
jgi:hypothetical protein